MTPEAGTACCMEKIEKSWIIGLSGFPVLGVMHINGGALTVAPPGSAVVAADDECQARQVMPGRDAQRDALELYLVTAHLWHDKRGPMQDHHQTSTLPETASGCNGNGMDPSCHLHACKDMYRPCRAGICRAVGMCMHHE